MADDPVWQAFAAEYGGPLPNGEMADVPPRRPSANGPNGGRTA
jgi:hypothetical protein